MHLLHILFPIRLCQSARPDWKNDIKLQLAQFLPTQSKNIHVIGPIFIEDISLKKIETDILSMHYTHQQKIDFINTIRTLPVLSITRFYEYGLMMHYCITGDKITVSDLQYPKTEKELPSEPEKEVIDAHGTWSFEQEMLKMVEDGNLNMKQFTSRMSSSTHLGSLGNGNPIRQLKNVTIIFTALCTRAAIRGGLPVNIAYTLSDRYITAIESCKRNYNFPS